ncbi:unnamed protein product, partial [Medioppia subpectinata]
MPAMGWKPCLVVCGPSGSGKTTLLSRLVADWPSVVRAVVSHTTRGARATETEAKDYYFVSKERFRDMEAKKEFLESSEFADNFYGTRFGGECWGIELTVVCTHSWQELRKVAESEEKALPVLDVDINGVLALRKHGLNAKYVLIKASLENLERNLKSRATEDAKSLSLRLSRAGDDLRYIEQNQHIFDTIIINDKIEDSLNRIKNFVQKRRFDDVINISSFVMKTMSETLEVKICLLGVSLAPIALPINGHLFIRTLASASRRSRPASFLTKTFIQNDVIYKLNIWDTAGQEMDSFASIQSWVRELQTHAHNDLVIALAANKCDLAAKVTSRDGREMAERCGALFWETSAKSAQNVNQLFESCGQLWETMETKFAASAALYGNNGRERALSDRSATKNEVLLK